MKVKELKKIIEFLPDELGVFFENERNEKIVYGYCLLDVLYREVCKFGLNDEKRINTYNSYDINFLKNILDGMINKIIREKIIADAILRGDITNERNS